MRTSPRLRQKSRAEMDESVSDQPSATAPRGLPERPDSAEPNPKRPKRTPRGAADGAASHPKRPKLILRGVTAADGAEFEFVSGPRRRFYEPCSKNPKFGAVVPAVLEAQLLFLRSTDPENDGQMAKCFLGKWNRQVLFNYRETPKGSLRPGPVTEPRVFWPETAYGSEYSHRLSRAVPSEALVYLEQRGEQYLDSRVATSEEREFVFSRYLSNRYWKNEKRRHLLRIFKLTDPSLRPNSKNKYKLGLSGWRVWAPVDEHDSKKGEYLESYTLELRIDCKDYHDLDIGDYSYFCPFLLYGLESTVDVALGEPYCNCVPDYASGPLNSSASALFSRTFEFANNMHGDVGFGRLARERRLAVRDGPEASRMKEGQFPRSGKAPLAFYAELTFFPHLDGRMNEVRYMASKMDAGTFVLLDQNQKFRRAHFDKEAPPVRDVSVVSGPCAVTDRHRTEYRYTHAAVSALDTHLKLDLLYPERVRTGEGRRGGLSAKERQLRDVHGEVAAGHVEVVVRYSRLDQHFSDDGSMVLNSNGEVAGPQCCADIHRPRLCNFYKPDLPTECFNADIGKFTWAEFDGKRSQKFVESRGPTKYSGFVHAVDDRVLNGTENPASISRSTAATWKRGHAFALVDKHGGCKSFLDRANSRAGRGKPVEVEARLGTTLGKGACSVYFASVKVPGRGLEYVYCRHVRGPVNDDICILEVLGYNTPADSSPCAVYHLSRLPIGLKSQLYTEAVHAYREYPNHLHSGLEAWFLRGHATQFKMVSQSERDKFEEVNWLLVSPSNRIVTSEEDLVDGTVRLMRKAVYANSGFRSAAETGMYTYTFADPRREERIYWGALRKKTGPGVDLVFTGVAGRETWAAVQPVPQRVPQPYSLGPNGVPVDDLRPSGAAGPSAPSNQAAVDASKEQEDDSDVEFVKERDNGVDARNRVGFDPVANPDLIWLD